MILVLISHTAYTHNTGGAFSAASTDIDGTDNTLVFDSGETFKPVQVPIIKDLFREEVETFEIEISNADEFASIDGPSTALVYIIDETGE